MKTLLIATKNPNKVREVEGILGHVFRFETLPGDVPEVEEDGATFLENALKKARQYSRLTSLPTLAEDSGLVVDALDGAPGVYSARFAGQDADAAANNRLLLERLAGVSDDRRTARFVCCLVYTDGGREEIFEGEVRGRIARCASGSSGFGYDPLFIPDGHDRTFADMPAQMKNSMSHRKRALMKFADSLHSASK